MTHRNRKKKGGRRKAVAPVKVVKDLPRSPVDVGRICTVLGLIPIPEEIKMSGLIDLWNDNTNYYLPRHEDQGKELRTMSPPLAEQEDEARLWADISRVV